MNIRTKMTDTLWIRSTPKKSGESYNVLRTARGKGKPNMPKLGVQEQRCWGTISYCLQWRRRNSPSECLADSFQGTRKHKNQIQNQKGRGGTDQTGQSEGEPFNVYERSYKIKSVCWKDKKKMNKLLARLTKTEWKNPMNETKDGDGDPVPETQIMWLSSRHLCANKCGKPGWERWVGVKNLPHWSEFSP